MLPFLLLRSKKPLLPISLDFSTLPVGPLPAVFLGPTWTVSSGHGVCNPTLGVKMFSDPGLEGAYTDGLAAGLSKTVTPTVSQSADVHGGAKAQSYTATARYDALYLLLTPVAEAWYLAPAYVKKTAGAHSTMYARFMQKSGAWTIWGTLPFTSATTPNIPQY